VLPPTVLVLVLVLVLVPVPVPVLVLPLCGPMPPKTTTDHPLDFAQTDSHTTFQLRFYHSIILSSSSSG
jgi:hypothetical protein